MRREAPRGAMCGLDRGEAGASLVSFALTFPILMAFTFGMMQVCLAYYNFERISELARDGTRYAIFRGSTCQLSGGGSCTASASSIQTYVTSLGLPAFGGATTSAVVSFPDGDEAPGHRVRVVLSCTYPYTIPFVASNGITMSSTSEMYIVQ